MLIRKASWLVVPVLALALAGCGQTAAQKYAKASATTIDQDMRTALGGLKSLHVHTVESQSGGSFLMDISIDNAGRCVGSLGDGDMKLNLIGTGPNSLYVNATSSFWIGSQGAAPAIAAVLADKWLTGVHESSIVGVCDLATFVKSYSAQTIAEDAPKVLGQTTVDGQDAVNLQITAGKATFTVSVAVSSPHYPLKIVAMDGKRTTVFSDFNATVQPTAPAGAQDLSKLKAKK